MMSWTVIGVIVLLTAILVLLIIGIVFLVRIHDDRGTQQQDMDALQASVDDLGIMMDRRINDSLAQINRSLGEMQAMASDVGDLKRLLSNVKTRGVVGEMQLGHILSEMLSPEQYIENAAVREGRERVEYAVIFPGEDGEKVYLPIDSKFPGDAYLNLQDAYDTGDRDYIKKQSDALRTAILKAARDIRTKYINPPVTTDFAIMFLPFEGLYAEVLRLNLVETLQRDYRVCIAGPTTMSAMINSFQVGFRSIAIQKQSGQIWKTLAAVQTEFDKFEKVLTDTQYKMDLTQKNLENLVGVRTRSIQRALKDIESADFQEKDI